MYSQRSSAYCCMYLLQMPHGGNCHQLSCPRNTLLQLEQVTNTLVSPHWWRGMYMALMWDYALSSGRWFLASCPTANKAETSLFASKLIIWILIQSMEFSHTSLWLSEWWYHYVEGEITIVTSFWWSSFERARKLVACCLGANWQTCSAMSPRAADWWSATLVVSTTE